ncbi:hypothetical protein RGQ29_013637 [Quercus rubra]|uniref:Uncharacterized protein n=1 Tax=Quercus rubra TaxID=3512 RepID=A0AAN7FLV0_QUERU|nr:hypothetical protein RGQ29_013637 [Quercus rubra]
MAEGLVTDLIKQLGLIAAREADQEIRLVVGVDKEVEKLKGNLQTVKAVLNDAEKRQVTEEVVKLWLEKLNNACYEMEDVVDEWSTAMIKSAIQKEEEHADDTIVLKKKVCSFIPSPSCCFRQVDKLVLRYDIAHKIKDLNGILDVIAKEKDRYQFQLTNDLTPTVVERAQTTSFVDVSEICGRDSVKNDLVGMLLGKGSAEERSPHLISLVGMGGIGKTTLAQLAYNDPEVQAYFKIKVWVCVSDPFDQCKVAKAILDSIKGQSSDMTELQILLNRICDEVRGKNFLLVCDDVWNEDSTAWEPFRIALKCVAPSSRIIVTTRKNRVAENMRSASMINLELLSKEDCWLMFSKLAFFDRDPRQSEQLKDLGRQIVEKCKGLPLAAKTLGSLMRFKRSREEWKNILDSKWWEFEDVEKCLYAPLFLSYYDLYSPLRRCFSFCAVFPKDYVFSSDELVFMWMAQGYIKSKENVEIEIIARDYFENLAIRSFFQDFERDENDGKIKKCKMHDIVHDFAQLMSKNVCFTINSNIGLETDYKTARHLELEIPKEAQFPESIYSAKNLRTLIFVDQSDYMLSTLFQHFRCLRILTLEDARVEYDGILRNLPDAVENFIHLRYLNLVNYCGDTLPETIGNLYNLQILKIIIDGSNLQKLPQGMSKLINLRHFNLSSRNGDCCSDVKFPRGFGRLTSLRTLDDFNVNGKGDNERCKLGELKNLNHLKTLSISGLGREVDECEAMNAQLKKKINLHTLKLRFSEYWLDIGIKREKDALVLNALEPPPNLEYLHIEFYEALILFPNWMMSLTNLKELRINGSSLECLPPLGKLPFLKSLQMWYIIALEKLGIEFLGIEESEKKEKGDIIKPLFPNLISLSFDYFFHWEEWNGIEEEEDCIRRFTIMPRLQDLSIWSCPKLKLLPNFLRATPLQKLEICGCPILEERCKRGTGEEWPKISHIPNIWIDWFYVQRDGREYEAEPKMAHVKWSGFLDSIEVPVPIEMSVTPNPYVYEFVYRVGCKEYEEEFVEDDDKKEESNEDEHCKIDNEIVQIDSREWNGIGGEEKEEEEDCIRRFIIMPYLQNLEILVCTKLKSVPNFLCTTPLQKLEISTCLILEECFKRGTEEDWPKISHIPIIFDYKLQFSSSPMCQWLKDKKFPLFSVHKFSYKFRFLDDDGEKVFAIVHVLAKFSNGLIRRCSFDPVMGNLEYPQKLLQLQLLKPLTMSYLAHLLVLFLMDKEDKINLKDETPSGTSRIQLRKEMNMILTPLLTTEIKEDDASQIYYMTSEDRERMFGECLGMQSWILNCQEKSQKKLINLVASECLKL